jgi:hypothetical protein
MMELYLHSPIRFELDKPKKNKLSQTSNILGSVPGRSKMHFASPAFCLGVKRQGREADHSPPRAFKFCTSAALTLIAALLVCR